MRDENGDLMEGAEVTFTVTGGDGTLSMVTATTDSRGRAATTLTLGGRPGPNTVEVTVEGLESLLFTADARATRDFDGDGEIGFSDFFLFAEAFGGSDPRFDLDGSGTVDFPDFFLFAESFGQPARARLMALARERIGLPDGPQLQQNWPNPFNSGTVISWFLLQVRAGAPGGLRPERAAGGGPGLRGTTRPASTACAGTAATTADAPWPAAPTSTGWPRRGRSRRASSS